MNAERLLEHFDRISDAADAVPRLRRFVLDLAVRGALVAARTSDAPADVPDAANRPPQAKAVELPIASLPFTVPSTWRWAYLTEVADVLYGFAFASGRFNASRHGMPLIRIRDISSPDTEAYFDGEYEDRYVVRNGDYLIGMDGDFNVRKWAGRDALLNQRVLRINKWHSQAAAGWCAIPLQMILDHIHGQTSQTTVKHLSAKQMNGVRIPLPPLAEQHRIVAKTAELMALCDQLEAAQADREARRDRLVSASLARVTEPASQAPSSARTSAQFHLDHFARLTTRPEHVKQLRQTILNLAVRGRLGSPDPSDEPALETLIRHGLKTTQEPQPSDLPPGWTSVQFEDVAVVSGGVTLGRKLGSRETVRLPYLRVANVKRGHFDLAVVKVVEVAVGEVEKYSLRRDDVLMTEGGDWDKVGRAAIWQEEVPDCLHQNHVFRARMRSPGISPRWCEMYFNSPIGRLYFESASKQTTNLASINMRQVRGCPVPLPPLAEQRRIVAKVDELMALCDQLEASLTSAATDQVRLLVAMLHDALVPAV